MNENIKNKLISLVNIFNDNLNKIKLIYNIDNEKKIKIFGKRFVDNNKKNCFLIINNKILEIVEEYTLDKNKLDKKLKIKFIEVFDNTNMSYMFSECNKLSSLTDISKWNTNNVTNMSYMFSGCKNLSSLPIFKKTII